MPIQVLVNIFTNLGTIVKHPSISFVTVNKASKEDTTRYMRDLSNS